MEAIQSETFLMKKYHEFPNEKCFDDFMDISINNGYM